MIPKLYSQKKDDCWRITLCNLLQISPKKIPDFVKKYGDDFVIETRKWLNKKKKSIVYIPFSCFLESARKYNCNFFPQGKCIAILDKEKDSHACLVVNGELLQKDDEEYSKVYGYFIVYDL